MTTRDDAIIEFAEWLISPPGRYLLDWEQARIDHAVADLFGFHALQLGLPQLDALRANRMPHRWVAQDSLVVPERVELPAPLEPITTQSPNVPVALHCDFDALPFASQSIDLVVLPHGLELARDPHETLREIERVLVPEGRVMIVGFNPASLWGLRQRLGAMRQRLGLSQRPRYCRTPASSSVTGACATGCVCSASRSNRDASVAGVPRCARRRGSIAGPGSKASASAGGRCSARCTS